MKDILIYGFGGFGHEVACLIQHINREKPTWNVLGYIDDGVEVGTECKYGKVLGDINTLNAWERPVAVVIAIGSTKYLELISQRITNPNIGNYNVLFPETRISGQTSIGNRNFFGARVFVAQRLKIGNDCRFGAGCYVLRKTKDGCLYMGNPAKKVEI